MLVLALVFQTFNTGLMVGILSKENHVKLQKAQMQFCALITALFSNSKNTQLLAFKRPISDQ